MIVYEIVYAPLPLALGSGTGIGIPTGRGKIPAAVLYLFFSPSLRSAAESIASDSGRPLTSLHLHADGHRASASI